FQSTHTTSPLPSTTLYRSISYELRRRTTTTNLTHGSNERSADLWSRPFAALSTDISATRRTRTNRRRRFSTSCGVSPRYRWITRSEGLTLELQSRLHYFWR